MIDPKEHDDHNHPAAAFGEVDDDEVDSKDGLYCGSSSATGLAPRGRHGRGARPPVHHRVANGIEPVQILKPRPPRETCKHTRF